MEGIDCVQPSAQTTIGEVLLRLFAPEIAKRDFSSLNNALNVPAHAGVAWEELAPPTDSPDGCFGDSAN